MSEEYRQRLEQYLSSMAQAKSMLERGIITDEDYRKTEALMAEKYGLKSRNIYRGIDLLYKEAGGNMSR